MDRRDREYYLKGIKEELDTLADPHKIDFVIDKKCPHPRDTKEWICYNTKQFYQLYFIETIWDIELLVAGYMDKLEKKESPENKTPPIETPLKVKGLPELNLAERYYIANEKNVFDNLQQLDILQKEKHKLLAIILGCSIDNAKHLTNGTYPPLNNITEDRKRELNSFMDKMD